MKKCSKCKKEKDTLEFCKNKRYKDGYHDTCKSCRKEYNVLNKDKIKEYLNNYNKINKEKCRNYNKNYYENNKEYYILHRKNRDKNVIKQYKINSKLYKLNWSKAKYKTDIHYKISQLLRIRLIDALKNKVNKLQSSIKLLGCSLDECKQHLESQFKPEMTWENHGKIWEIDHIKPCASFDLTKLEEQEKCFHYSNLQPLTVS